jgi:hypothetical protein
MIDELTNYAFNAGRYAEKLEQFNRDVERLLNEMGNGETEVEGEVREDGGDSVRGLQCGISSRVRAQVEAKVYQDR